MEYGGGSSLERAVIDGGSDGTVSGVIASTKFKLKEAFSAQMAH
jgi:hypothetical protein